MNSGVDGKIEAIAGALLRKADLSCGDIRCVPLTGGRNNRVYRVEASSGTFLLKQYFQGGYWDRLAAESRFLRFCEQAGIEQTPRLLAEDVSHSAALHSWIDGGRLTAPFASENDVAEAAAFLSDLALASRQMARRHEVMLPARDACLCFGDFFRSPRERVVDLEKALLAGQERPFAHEALVFVRKTLIPEWKRAEEMVATAFAGRDMAKSFPVESLIASPSDFGFHNALRYGGGLSFVDFEYAGMDDPAKAIGDFVCQADFSPPKGTLERLAMAVCGDTGLAKELADQTQKLLPLFRIKFCCIVLNEFKNTDAARRDFSLGGQSRDVLGKQLLKAMALLKSEEDMQYAVS